MFPKKWPGRPPQRSHPGSLHVRTIVVSSSIGEKGPWRVESYPRRMHGQFWCWNRQFQRFCTSMRPVGQYAPRGPLITVEDWFTCSVPEGFFHSQETRPRYRSRIRNTYCTVQCYTLQYYSIIQIECPSPQIVPTEECVHATRRNKWYM